MGCILPEPSFMQGLRDLCDREGILLIFDEVMTGFRLAPGGAQERLGIRADLVTYGKVIGGGLPVGAFGGPKEIMAHIAPLGKVYQAGTLSGNPIAMMAGYTTLRILKNTPGIYEQLEDVTLSLHEGLAAAAAEHNVPVTINRLGSMISLHFCSHAVSDFATSAASDIKRFNHFFHYMLDGGVYLPPSAFETWFISASITAEHIDQTVSLFSDYCRQYRDGEGGWMPVAG
jgi:glutamate-1-semialdehyde 2,1-aminomutase